MLEIFFVFLRLGCTSFGGPVAHLGFFREEFVLRRKWLDDPSYADLVAFCQFLPGPASSQVGMSLGLKRGGVLGALVAWLGFTLPSALVLTGFAYSISYFDLSSHWLHGLKVAAVAVVAHAVWGMARSMTPDLPRLAIALATALVLAFQQSASIQVICLIAAGLIGYFLLKPAKLGQSSSSPVHSTRSRELIAGILFVALIFLLPVSSRFVSSAAIDLFDIFYRAGSLVFGGGHVVLPLLQNELVTPGFVPADLFMAGYGAAQAIPGPLFSLSAYLGAVAKSGLVSWVAAILCLVATFLPSLLLVLALLPFWDRLRSRPGIQKAATGINAAVVGLLVAALYHPVWTSAIFSSFDFLMALLGFVLLWRLKFPSWAVVLSCLVVYAIF